MSEFDFGSLLPEEERKSPMPTQTIVKRQYTPRKTKTDNLQAIRDFERVINCIHVNAHKAQRKMLEESIGSASVVTVRKWLSDKYLEALTQ